MKTIAISDLHGYLPRLKEQFDVLFIAGDIVPLDYQRNMDKSELWFMTDFAQWVKELPCDKVIFVAGNHDFWLEHIQPVDLELIIIKLGLENKLVYLEDSSYTYKGITIYGCPWCDGPFGWAFSPCDVHSDVHKYYDKIPECDVLLCHQPPKVGDVGVSYPGKSWARDFGSDYLRKAAVYQGIKTVICGHIHSGKHGGVCENETTYYNVSLKSEDYKPSYNPTVIEM